MNKKLAILFALITFASAPAHAGVDIGAIINGVINGVVNWAMSSLVPAIQASTKAIQGEITKASVVQKNTAEGVAQWQAQNDLKYRAHLMKRDYEQPDNICSSISAAEAQAQAQEATRRETFVQAATQTRKMLGQRDHVAAVRNFDAETAPYCTQEDVAVGRCKERGNYEGGDTVGALLFTSPAGGYTYDQPQERAVQSMITRLTGFMPTTSRYNQSYQTPQGRLYARYEKDAIARAGLAQSVLHSISSMRRSQAGLGQRSGLPNVAPNASLMSIMYAAAQEANSPQQIAMLAKKPSPSTILRSLAVTNSRQLMVDFHSLESLQQIEALMAVQLALVNQQISEQQMTAISLGTAAGQGMRPVAATSASAS